MASDTSRASLQSHYPWVDQDTPLITLAPMRLISGPALATQVSLAGGLGFLGCGTDPSLTLPFLTESASLLSNTTTSPLPIGIGFLLWDIPDEIFKSTILPLLKQFSPAAIWLYAPRGDTPAEWLAQLQLWVSSIKEECPKSDVWLQIGSLHEAKELLPHLDIDVLVLQGGDAGGHGLKASTSLLTLAPEVGAWMDGFYDNKNTVPDGQKTRKRPYTIAAGGLALPVHLLLTSLLDFSGITLGTLFLTAPEALLAPGYASAVLDATDGGQSTTRSSVYDYLRRTRGWPARYGGRGVVNESFRDWESGKISVEENVEMYQAAEGRSKTEEGVWKAKGGRMTTYAGTGVGLVTERKPAGEIVRGLREGYVKLCKEKGMKS